MSRSELFPLTASANTVDHLVIGGCDVTALADEYGTPLYVFDETTLRAQALAARDIFRAGWHNSLVLYATKAYFSPFLARFYRDLDLGLDVTSEGEMEIARRADFPRDQIYLHGNNKTPDEIRAALMMGVSHLVVDNLDEIKLIAALARELSCAPQLLIRLSPNIDPHTHRYLTTGVADSKFGLSRADATRAVELIQSHSHLNVLGLHVHIGSQIFEPEAIVNALDSALDLAAEWQARFGFVLREINLGGGWGVAYTEQQQSLDVNFLAEKICSELLRRGLDSTLKLLVEPGRALVARAAVALYRVGSIKHNAPGRSYAAIDGGMGDNIRPSLYNATYTARVANKFDAAPTEMYAIAGRYCEQGDVLIESIALPRLERGDIIAVPNAGAYQLPMASNYNLISRPAIALVSEGNARLLRRRETMDDLLRGDMD